MSSLSFIRRYIRHQLNSQNQFRIHSPFVYEFYQSVLFQPKKESFFDPIESVRKDLLNNRQWIDIVDLGAGTGAQGKILKQRQVREIASKALKPARLARILGRICQFSKVRSIIELGTSLGITTAYLSSYCRNAGVYSLEGSPEIARIAQANFNALQLDNIRLITGDFDQSLGEVLVKCQDFPRLIYIDGNHRYEPTLRYFNQFLENSSMEDVLIFDDIHWSDEMENAWEEVKKHKKVFLTLDLFYFGIVYLKDDRAKEDFRIRMV